MNEAYRPRHYVMADTDKMSEERVRTFERERNEQSKEEGDQYMHQITRVPRSREVGEAWLSTVLSLLYATLFCLPVVWKSRPDLILCNGPGTCIPLCAVGFLLKVLWLKPTKIVYVESMCRVETLSLSAKLLYYFADQIVVQWPQLKQKYPMTTYLGRL